MPNSDSCLFYADGICKRFGQVRALNDFHITIAPGEIRGLVGENGSGKSTFSSIVAGIQKCDAGNMFLNGIKYHPNGAVDAMDKGVSMVIQEQGTISKITIAANIFFGKEDLFVRRGVLNVRRMNQEARRALENIGVTQIDPAEMIDTLSFEDRKLVELARALYTMPKLWIVDETTTALSITGREILYRQMQRVCDCGGAVIFISHDIDEIMRMCDTLTILRDGVLTANLRKTEFSADAIRQLMIGRELSGHYYRSEEDSEISPTVVLRMQSVTAADIENVSLELHKGEILGIGGLSDCGIHTLGKVLYGLISPKKGRVIKDETHKVKSASWSVRHGMAYVSKNRDTESMMPVCSVKDNICLPSLRDLAHFILISHKSQKKLAKQWSEKMEVKAPSIETFCNALSGGNKQKVVLAKWLGKGAETLILDCPTRGIDVGTKASIYQLIDELKKAGRSIVLISEELPELIGMSDRILLLKDGCISGEFSRKDGFTESKLIQKMI